MPRVFGAENPWPCQECHQNLGTALAERFGQNVGDSARMAAVLARYASPAMASAAR